MNNNINWLELFHQFPRGIALLENDGSLLYGNDRLKLLFRNNNETLTLRHEAARSEWERFLESFLKGSSSHDQLVVVIPDNALDQHWFSIKLIRSSEKSLIFLLEEDVTDQHNYELNLKKARDAAEQATKTKSEFLANMSHEIRTPIHTIIGMSELLNLTPLDQEQEEYGSQIRFSADILLSLINDILDFSKIEAGQMELEYTSCNLQELMEDSIDLISLEAHKKGVEVGLFAQPGTDFQIEGDPTRLRQIAVNLTNNAVKFTQKGQVMIYLNLIEQDARSVRIRISVKDSGIGIAESKKINLFNAFTQADSSTTRRFGGTGLGLTISKNLVTQMGGELKVDSREGEGSEFYFSLTFPRSVPYRTVPELMEFGENLKGVSVLLVDDNPSIRGTLKKYLSSWGCLVEEAGSGREAIGKMKDRISRNLSHFDLCITDQLMPEMDGWQLASEVHSSNSLTPTAMILMSLKGSRGTEEAKMKLLGWFAAYITKPIRKKELWVKCLQALNSDQAEPEDLEELEDLEDLELLDTPLPKTKEGAVPAEKKEGLILIAEDHPVNRKLFESILVKQGYNVILAENGQEALDLALSKHPDLIFMDCQMPVMNGYESTRNIRESGLKIPIIAVTANALRGEQEKCFKSGMNDFLPKPFKNKDLLPVLNNWYRPTGLSGTEDLDELEEIEDAEESELLPEEVAPVFDFNQAMDTFMDDRELLVSLLKPYLDQVTGQLEELSSEGIMEDSEKIRAIAHSIKGSSRNLSMMDLGNRSEVLEHAARDGDMETVEKAIPQVATAFDKVKRAVLKLLSIET